MADVWLKRCGWEEGDVPNVCMKCGRDAPDRVEKTITWVPDWVRFMILFSPLVLIIVAMLVWQQRRTLIPLCARHKNHWRSRNRFTVWSLVFLGVGNGIFAAAMAYLPNPDYAVGLILIAVALSLLVCVLVIAIVQLGAIRARQFETDTICLMNVSASFQQAYANHRDREEKSRDDAKELIGRTVRERWNQSARPASDETRTQVHEERPGDGPRAPSNQYRPG